MHAEISHSKQVILQDAGNYIRAIKPEFDELRYAIEEQAESWDKIRGMLWGFPEMIKYDIQIKRRGLGCICMRSDIWIKQRLAEI